MAHVLTAKSKLPLMVGTASFFFFVMPKMKITSGKERNDEQNKKKKHCLANNTLFPQSNYNF